MSQFKVQKTKSSAGLWALVAMIGCLSLAVGAQQASHGTAAGPAKANGAVAGKSVANKSAASTPAPGKSAETAPSADDGNDDNDQGAAAADPEAQALQQLMMQAGDEPGAQIRGLEGYVAKHPDSRHLAEIYTVLVKAATALNDEKRVLTYNEKLQELDPGDLSQRIKVLNLLLLNQDADSVARARRYASELAQLVEAKAQEARPAEMGEARWNADMDRLRALAELFEGVAAQQGRDYVTAEGKLQQSLNHAQTEEAAEHLAAVDVALNKPQQAINAYALALALPGATIVERKALRDAAGALYRKQHNGSEQGFGDLILAQFDRVAATDAQQQARLHPGAANVKAGTPGAIVLTGLDGQRHTLGDLRGKLVVVDFWATWCGPCKVQHPIVEALKKKYASDAQIAFVAVNEDEDRDKVEPFLTANGWEKTTWLDAGLAGYYGVDSLPTLMIFNPSGTVVYRQSGFVPELLQQQLDKAIATQLAQLKAQPASARGVAAAEARSLSKKG